jgi:hypothetical protein
MDPNSLLCLRSYCLTNVPEVTHCQSKSQSYFRTGGLPPISSSWRQAPWNWRPEIFFQLNPCGNSLYVTSSLTRRWVCLLWIYLIFRQVYVLHIYRVFRAQAGWTLTHTSHKDAEQSTTEASITLDGVTLTDSLIRWSPNEWPSVFRGLRVSADYMMFWTSNKPAQWTCYSMLLKIIYKSAVSTNFAKQIMSILRILYYNGSLVTRTVVSSSTAKFKPLMFSTDSLLQLVPLVTPRYGPRRKHRLFL